jgi:hypothetical protein
MMAISTIQLPSSSEPFVTQSVSLEGRTYVLTFDWNSRSDRWSFSIATEAGQAILNGAMLQVGVDLLRTIPDTLDYVPPGQLVLAGKDDPTLDTIGSVSLFYVPSDA